MVPEGVLAPLLDRLGLAEVRPEVLARIDPRPPSPAVIIERLQNALAAR
jgi:hypothetical protein